MFASNVRISRVVLSRCNPSGYSRWHAESIGVGYAGREAGADKLQPAKQLLHEHVHRFRWALHLTDSCTSLTLTSRSRYHVLR